LADNDIDIYIDIDIDVVAALQVLRSGGFAAAEFQHMPSHGSKTELC
jgi:hypothetical protein